MEWSQPGTARRALLTSSVGDLRTLPGEATGEQPPSWGRAFSQHSGKEMDPSSLGSPAYCLVDAGEATGLP